MVERGATDVTAISDDHLKDVCKMGQGAECCAWLYVDGSGFQCAKANTPMMLSIIPRLEHMTAKGDNCGGWFHLEGELAT